MKLQTLPLSSLTRHSQLQMRVTLDLSVVAEYADFLRDGGRFRDPIRVVHEEITGSYFLVDGFHRTIAAENAGLDSLEADVIPGNLRDAILLAVSTNVAHGVRLSNLDKRKAVSALLKDEEWRNWSDREIARRCGASHVLVGQIRRELGIDAQADTRTTKSGGNYSTRPAMDKEEQSDMFGRQSVAKSKLPLPVSEQPIPPVAAVSHYGWPEFYRCSSCSSFARVCCFFGDDSAVVNYGLSGDVAFCSHACEKKAFLAHQSAKAEPVTSAAVPDTASRPLLPDTSNAVPAQEAAAPTQAQAVLPSIDFYQARIAELEAQLKEFQYKFMTQDSMIEDFLEKIETLEAQVVQIEDYQCALESAEEEKAGYREFWHEACLISSKVIDLSRESDFIKYSRRIESDYMERISGYSSLWRETAEECARLRECDSTEMEWHYKAEIERLSESLAQIYSVRDVLESWELKVDRYLSKPASQQGSWREACRLYNELSHALGERA